MSVTYKNFVLTLTSVMLVLGFHSCSKTEYEYEKSPYNTIQQFQIIGSNGDSVKCLVSGDSITIHWNPDVELPETITPKIVVDDKATISPVSGEAVPLNESTTYTVMAENGETKTYRLKIVLNIPLPTISSANKSLTWLTQTQINIFGENFLANAEQQVPDVYLQRVADGVEIPLELVEGRTTNYSMLANLPAFSAEQDTGLHRLYIKYHDRVTASTDIRFLVPPITYANPVASLVQDGQDVHSGDKLTVSYAFSDDYNGKIASYYHARNIDYAIVYFSPSYQTINITDNIEFTDNTITFQLPDIDQHIGETIAQYRFIYKSVPPESALFSSYYLRGFPLQPTTVKAK